MAEGGAGESNMEERIARVKADRAEDIAVRSHQSIIKLERALEKNPSLDPESVKTVKALLTFVKGVSANSDNASFNARRELERVLEEAA